MFSKRTIVTGLVTFVVFFLVNWLLWGIIFSSTWENMSSLEMTPDPNLLWLALGYLVWGWLMAFIFPYGYSGGSPAGEGFRFGLIIWGLLSLGMGLFTQGFQPENTGAFLFGQVVTLVGFAVTGIVLGIVSVKMAAPERVVTEAAVSPPMPEPAAPEPEAPADEGEGDETGGAMV